MPNITRACYRYLAAQPDLVALLGDDGGTPWIFQFHLQATVAGSQTSALVISQSGSWQSPNDHNTAKFPRLVLTIYSDPDRTVQNFEQLAAETRARLVYDALDLHMHRPTNEPQLWSDVWTLKCASLGDPRFGVLDASAPEVVTCEAQYGVQIG